MKYSLWSEQNVKHSSKIILVQRLKSFCLQTNENIITSQIHDLLYNVWYTDLFFKTLFIYLKPKHITNCRRLSSDQLVTIASHRSIDPALDILIFRDWEKKFSHRLFDRYNRIKINQKSHYFLHFISLEIHIINVQSHLFMKCIS